MSETYVVPEIVTRMKNKLAEVPLPSNEELENYRVYLGETSLRLDDEDLFYLAAIEAVVAMHQRAAKKSPLKMSLGTICFYPPPPHYC